MDDPREFLEEAAAEEEPEVLGHLRAEMSRIRATTSAKETPFGDVGKVQFRACIKRATACRGELATRNLVFCQQ